jgi:anti-anti-sigma factor
MKVQRQSQGNVTLLAPHGPLIGEELVDFRRAIEESSGGRGRRVVADLSDVPYVDSAGIELLLELCGLHVSALQRPKLAALNETCLEALELTDVLPRLEVFDTVDNALRSCQR